MNPGKWFALAKPGKYTDMFGHNVEIKKENLEHTAASYDPAKQMAPITIGHPTTGKEPAWGWIEGLKMVGDTLMFKPCNVVAEFGTMVNKGLYPNVSGGWNLPQWTLNHIAFLGAQPPAIEGLGRVQFAGSQDDVTKLDLSSVVSEWSGKANFSSPTENWLIQRLRIIGSIIRRLRDESIEKDGLEAADKKFNSWDIDYLTQEPPVEQVVQSTQANFSTQPGVIEMDPQVKAALDAMTAQIAQFSGQISNLTSVVTKLEASNKLLTEENLAIKADAQKKDFAFFCKQLVDNGQLLPDAVESTVKVMESLAASSQVQMSSGQTVPSLDLFKQQLQSAPKLVQFGHIMTKQFGGTTDGKDPEIEEGKAIAAALK